MTDRKANGAALLLSLMMVLVPALGSPSEELLQDTLKSMLVSFFALAASFAFFWQLRRSGQKANVHLLLCLPLGLMAYALASMAWSHAYLGGVEAIRWFVFSLILLLGLNVLTQARLTPLAWSIHLGAVLASLWAALQFWTDFSFFAQGPNPASTFVNRNFFGEFLVCTLPFSALLLSRVRDKISVFLLTFSLGFNGVALMMTGTRSALIGLALLLVLVPLIAYRYRRQVVSTGWRRVHALALLALLLGTVLVLGSIPTRNAKLIAETGRGNAMERALSRTLSMAQASEYSQGSFSMRAVMWKATARMILANPLGGVGAGAWEVHAPRYQQADSQLEADYYAHNEFLQLVAEYGLAGWLFLLCLLSYLVWAAQRTWADQSPAGQSEGLLRALTLASLLVFLLVSNAGFSWRMASTGALFALSLSILAASDARLGTGATFLLRSVPSTAGCAVSALCGTAIASGIAIYISQQAVLCESRLVRAVKIALTISQSGAVNDVRWDKVKGEMLLLVRDGIAINPHYRKLTPIVADALAQWGDWKNATWIWESVLQSRPYVVALLANVARGQLQAGEPAKAQESLSRAMTIHPSSPALATLQVILWSRSETTKQQAGARAKELLRSGAIDYDLLRTAYHLGMRNRDPELAILALELRIKQWPDQAVDSWLKLGDIYGSAEAKDERKALHAYSAAIEASAPAYKSSVLAKIPPHYQHR